MKQLAAISDNEFDGADADTVIENLDKELAEILKYADVYKVASGSKFVLNQERGSTNKKDSTVLTILAQCVHEYASHSIHKASTVCTKLAQPAQS